MFGVINLVFGTFFGNYLASGRDKRKEFNEVTEQFRIEIKRGIEHVRVNSGGFHIDYGSFTIIEDHLHWYEKSLFRLHVRRCEKANADIHGKYDPSTSTVEFYEHKIPILKRRLKSLLHYIKRR